MYKRMYVWEVAIRIFHWSNLVAIVLLAITGLYIGNPFLVSNGEVYREGQVGEVDK